MNYKSALRRSAFKASRSSLIEQLRYLRSRIDVVGKKRTIELCTVRNYCTVTSLRIVDLVFDSPRLP